MTNKIDWCARLRKFASGELTGEIPALEYSLAADEIEKLRNGIRLAVTAHKTGGMIEAELAALEAMIDVPNAELTRIKSEQN